MLRETAERRVRELQARQMTALIEWQEEERKKDLRIQKQILDQQAQKEAALIEDHRRAVDRLAREWQQQRDRLANVPGPAPSFGFAPPQRDVKGEYERAREQYERRLQALQNRLKRDLADCRRERADQLAAFQTANLAREHDFDEQRTAKAEEQRLSFDTLVHRQMRYGRTSIGEEFARSSRPPDRNL